MPVCYIPPDLIGSIRDTVDVIDFLMADETYHIDRRHLFLPGHSFGAPVIATVMPRTLKRWLKNIMDVRQRSFVGQEHVLHEKSQAVSNLQNGALGRSGGICSREEERIMDLTQNAEELRRSLLEEIYAGAASGLGAMLMAEEKIRQAGPEELADLARQHGIK